MALFAKDKRPDAAILEARIQELEQRRDEIPQELAAARGEMTRRLATGENTDKARREVAELTAELEALPESIDALKGELRQAKIDAVAAERAREREALVKRLDGLRKSHAAILKAIDDYNSAIDAAGELGGTNYAEGATELRAGKRLPTEPHGVPTIAVVPDIERGAEMILRRFDEETRNRIKSAGRAEREPSTVGEAFYLDESSGKMKPISERPPRKPPEAVTIDRKPGADDTGDRIAKKAPGFYQSRK